MRHDAHLRHAANTGSSPTGIHYRRDIKRRACPPGHKSCPVYGSTSGRGFLKAYECVDVKNDLESCGGCVANDSPFGERTFDGGRDCSAIPNVNSVTCKAGRCLIGASAWLSDSVRGNWLTVFL